MVTLGIETSCDETACGLVDHAMRVLANEVFSQADMHALYGGVVPEIAARAHLEKIDPMVRLALEKGGIPLDQVDRIAFTRGPGLLGPLLVGASFARALSFSTGIPAVGVNHLEGHLATAFLTEPALQPPFLCLVVSGGHSEFCRVDENLRLTLLGKTRDDAAGEAFDKCGKILGLGYPAGPAVAKMAEGGKRDFLALPKALDQRDNFEFSFSGLKASMLRYVQSQTPDFIAENRASLCASLESAIVEILVKKSINALEATHLETLTVVGGVSANMHLRARLVTETRKRGLRTIFPPPALSGDNGAMIAAIGQLKANLGIRSGILAVEPALRWA